jgi:hypothetical protein
VQVVRDGDVLALGTARTGVLRQYAVLARAGIDAVSRVWGSTTWSQRVVVIVPRTQAEFGRLLLRESRGLDQVAAVTTGDLGPGPRRAGNDRVVVNPGAFARLGDTGRHVVLTHELTHVAVRQSTGAAVPTWLSEGFADYVGYRDTGVSEQVGAGDLLALVRAGHGPKHLPDAADFDPTRTTIAPSYSGSWVACTLIAQRYGTDRLVALYRRAASAGSPEAEGGPSAQARLAAAFPKALDISLTRFTADWLHHLDELAA